MQQSEDTIKQQQNEIEDLKRKLRLKDEAEAKVGAGLPLPCLRRHTLGAPATRRILMLLWPDSSGKQQLALLDAEWRLDAPPRARVRRAHAPSREGVC